MVKIILYVKSIILTFETLSRAHLLTLFSVAMLALLLHPRWRICIPIEHFKCKNNFDHLLIGACQNISLALAALCHLVLTPPYRKRRSGGIFLNALYWRGVLMGNTVLSGRLFAVGTLAGKMVENHLAHAHRFRRHFHVFVFLDVFQGFFEREDDRRNDAGLVVGTRSTHVG